MARRRFQNPTPFRSGKWWYLLHWQDEFAGGKPVRKKKRTKLARATMPEREVKKIAAEILRAVNQGLVTIGSAMNFAEFVETVYKPTMLPLMVKSAQARSKSVLKIHLLPVFGKSSLRDVSPQAVQRYLSSLAESELGDEARDKNRDVLSSVMKSAVQFGYLTKNPVEGLRLPPAKRGRRNKPYLTLEQLETLVNSIAEPYASMVFVAMYTGLRVSELIGLKWRNVHADSTITVDERYSRGEWGAPKSDASNATVSVDPMVIERIERLKTLMVSVRAGRATRLVRAVRSYGPDDLVFPSLLTGAPMRDNNVLVRHLKPAASKLGIGLVNWQVLRRSFCMGLKEDGADIKDAQALMRHSRASTTLDVYQQFVPESQRRVVERLGRRRQLAVANSRQLALVK